VVLPFVNAALAGRAPFRRGVDSLRDEGVRILLGPGGFEPHPPRTGSGPASAFPWHLALNEADRSIGPHELAATGERRRPNFLPAAL
jgi:hypothetical protein